ncbi:hypothetical protein LOK49_LG03G03550 [Camellia lanceoleosa]|uniref:Uncharacterized protein n=1 Tax=Camellia lanceoleosa TaxID=1840588 RepID=A0ACC0IF13_9ERIC|nr:hypothetical protein LOK49_LG03G03550 [Camellia lanceoleosa]
MKFSYTCTCGDLLIIDDGYCDDGGGCGGALVVVCVCLGPCYTNHVLSCPGKLTTPFIPHVLSFSAARHVVSAMPVARNRMVLPTTVLNKLLEAVYEIAIFIHRFHNLNLFQQGWYQIKITMRREDSDDSCLGMPARVVQYEGHCAMWKLLLTRELIPHN